MAAPCEAPARDREATAVPEGEDCVVGGPDGPTVVLYGDSHAEQWFPAMARLARSECWRLLPLAKLACPPGGALVRNAHWDRPHTECARWHDCALQRIRAEDPDLVVVSIRADDGLITYRDDDHLTATFAATLSSALALGLRPVSPG